MYLDLLEKGVQQGIIHLHLPNGKSYKFGTAGREAHWIIKNEKALPRIARNWEWQLGESYMQGDWDTPGGQLHDLLYILRSNFDTPPQNKALQMLLKLFTQWNRVTNSYRNVSHHYDLGEAFFRLFLDKDMHYSCAYFCADNDSLEQAQKQKCRHIAQKLMLQPGQKVLDIGCGWGSLACYLAQNYNVDVVGITLSRRQHAIAIQRAQKQRLKNVNFKLEDYRQHRGRYDRIVSVGMFEHVGAPYYATFFDQMMQLMAQNGSALVHSIGHSGPSKIVSPWITRHIFPGGHIPSLSEMTTAVEKANFMFTDIEVLRQHYAKTLKAWFERFQYHRGEIVTHFGEEFCRMWEFYLAVCQVSFECTNLVVYQMQLARQHHVIPITRDYMYKTTVEAADLSVVRIAK